MTNAKDKYVLHDNVCWSLWLNSFSHVTAIANVRADDWAIGKDGGLLTTTRHAEDMKMFQTQTRGADWTIVGRRTADSINSNWKSEGVILPGRRVAVGSRSGLWISRADADKPTPRQRCVVAGGSWLYKAAMPQCHDALITVTDADMCLEPADSYFPLQDLIQNMTKLTVAAVSSQSKLQAWQKRYD